MTLNRITIMIESEILERCRKIQAKRLVKENKAVSLSNVIDQLIRMGLKN